LAQDRSLPLSRLAYRGHLTAMYRFVSILLVVPALSQAGIHDDDSLTCSRDESGSCIQDNPSALHLLQAKFELDKAGAKLELDRIATGGSKILVLGDSNAQMSCNDLGRFCGGSQVVNMAVGGSTAKQWSEGQCTFGDVKQGQAVSSVCPAGASCCNSTKAFLPEFGSGYTHAWLSIGGNDFLDSKPCGSLRGEALQDYLEKAVERVRSRGPTGLKIVMTGYVVPSVRTTPYGLGVFGCGTSPSALKPLNDAIAAAVLNQTAKGHDVTFVDVAYVNGATNSSLSPAQTHADAIHLNSKGYCKVFSSSGMQNAFACSGSAATRCSPQQCESAAEAYVTSPSVLLEEAASAKSLLKGGGSCAANVANPTCGATAAPVTAAPVTAAPGTAAPVTAAPGTPAPATAAPVTTPPCQNNDAGIVEAARSVNVTISGCSDLEVSHCSGEYEPHVKQMCPLLCNTCPQ